MGFFAAWGWQAVDAYRRAVAAGGSPGGAIQTLWLAPLALVAFTLFWLRAGGGASPSATLRGYVAAWRAGHPDVAATLFVAPRDPASVADEWTRDAAYLEGRLRALEARGETLPRGEVRPLDRLVFELVDDGTRPSASGTAIAVVEFVRPETVSGSFFGLFPTASQRSVVVERVGEVRLRVVDGEAFAGLRDGVWRIESVDLPGPG